VKHREFEDFYIRSKDKCFRAVLAAVGNVAEADDYLAEAYTRAWLRWNQVNKHNAPEAWVVLVALNLHRDQWRSSRLWNRLRPPTDVKAPELDLDVDLLKALRALPDRQRDVVVLRILLDQDNAQVAAALGLAPATVSVHLHRALTSLRLRVTSPMDSDETLPTDSQELELHQ
jgi:RNA polymerase sigma-70 factor (ECF subfamily)